MSNILNIFVYGIIGESIGVILGVGKSSRRFSR